MISFGIVHNYGFGITYDARTALSIIQCRNGIEVRNFIDLETAYRYGAYMFAKRYVTRSSTTDIRVIMPTFDAMTKHCLFDIPGMPPFGVLTDRCFALLTGQGQIGNTASFEDLLWFLTEIGSHESIWIRECVDETTAWEWQRNAIVPMLMVESAYRPYVGVIPRPHLGNLVQAVQPGYLSPGMNRWTSPEGLLPSGSSLGNKGV